MTTTSLIGLLLHWYIVDMPRNIVRSYARYAAAFAEVFAFIFLIRTLFSPWKNIVDAYPKKGFNLERIAETLTLNVTARVIGFVIRVFAMIAGILVQALCLAFFFAYLIFWITFPLIAVIGFPALLLFYS